MVWLPQRGLTRWERSCIDRVHELGLDTRIIDSMDGYDVPISYTNTPERKSDWVRFVELCVPRVLYIDCDVYLHAIPQLGAHWACERNGGRPHHAVMWSGDYPEIAVQTLEIMQNNYYAHTAMANVLRKHSNRGNWEYIPSGFYQHKDGPNG